VGRPDPLHEAIRSWGSGSRRCGSGSCRLRSTCSRTRPSPPAPRSVRRPAAAAGRRRTTHHRLRPLVQPRQPARRARPHPTRGVRAGLLRCPTGPTTSGVLTPGRH